MKIKTSYPILILALVLVGLYFPGKSLQAQDKLAQSGFQFLSVGTDARFSGLGDAYTTAEGYGSAVFYNPAGMARMEKTLEVMLTKTNWIADISHYALSAAWSPANGRYGSFAFSLQNVDYGDVQGTMVSGNSDGYIDTEIMHPSAFGIGIGYARYITDRFAVGGHIKYVTSQLGRSAIPDEGVYRNVAGSMAFDFGTIYQTHFRGFAFGMSVRNFSQEVKFEEEGFQLPLTFKLGFRLNALEIFNMQTQNQSLLLLVDAAHPRSYHEYINMGAEYSFRDLLQLRFGYATAQDEYGMSMGFGVSLPVAQFDYAYTPFGEFNHVHRFSIKLSI